MSTAGPVEQRYKDQMTAVMRTLDQFFNGNKGPRKTGVAVLVFSLEHQEEGGRVNYMSNVDRGDMLTAMKEFIARNEGRFDDRGGAA
jgi:hypothetical protein